MKTLARGARGRARRLPLGAAPTAGCPAASSILGFDGVDAQIVEQMLAAGRAARTWRPCKARGGYSPLTPTVPAQTPVSWATFSTGLDPGGHEIFDFLKRDPANLIPTFAVAEETVGRRSCFGKKNAGGVRGAAACRSLRRCRRSCSPGRRRRAAAVAPALGRRPPERGAFLAVRAWLPATRPWVAEQPARARRSGRRPVRAPGDGHPHARDVSAGGLSPTAGLLSGLGVPDLSGRIGKPAYYTSDPFFAPREGNDFSIEIVRLESNVGPAGRRGSSGPPGRAFGREGTIDLPMTLTVSPTRATA